MMRASGWPGTATIMAVLVVALLSERARAADCPIVTFSPGATFPAAAQPAAVAIADFNGDGRADLAVANEFSMSVSVLLGNGDGTFQSATDFPTHAGPAFVVTGDFNRDGKLDLAVAASSTGEISILRGNGNGTFQAPTAYSVGDIPRSIVVGDFNSDGRSDLAAANRGSSTVGVLLGNASGGFGPANTNAVGPNPVSIAAADFDGDGITDLVTANSAAFEGTGGYSIMIGRANGMFRAALDYEVGISPREVVAHDFNGDGDADLALADFGGFVDNRFTNSSVLVLFGNGDGTFGAPVSHMAGEGPLAMARALLNDDAYSDLVVVNSRSRQASALFGAGTGGFFEPDQYSTGVLPSGVAIGDLNGDGIPDFAVTEDTGVRIFTGACITNGADLLLRQTGTPNPICAGNQITYTLTITNRGPQQADSITVSNVLPFAATFVSCNASGGGVCGGEGRNRVVTFASLAAGTSAQITLVATVNSPFGELLVNSATVSALTADWNPTNNSAAANNILHVAPTISCPPNIVASTAPGRCTGDVFFSPTTTGSPAPTVVCRIGSLAIGSFFPFPLGTSTVDCTASNICGTAACSFTVTIVDTRQPSITCSNVMYSTDVGECTRSNVTYEVVVIDNCPGVNVACTPPEGSTFPKGVTPVMCTATDAAGNSATCNFNVTVNDTGAPTILCPTNIVADADLGTCSKTNVTYAAIVSDNCPGATVSCVPPSGSTFAKGTTNVTCTATDASGNTTNCSFTVRIDDLEPPSLVCPSNMVVNADSGACSKSNVTYTATAADNCPGVTVTCAPASGSTFSVGVTTVTCTAKDAATNTTSCAFTVTVQDVQMPTLACADIVVVTDAGRCSKSNVTYAVGSDNCPGVAVTCVPPSGSTFEKGVNTVNCTALDNSGNSTNCTFTVTVNDTRRPSIICPANIVAATDEGRCGKTNVTFVATATDNCPGVIVECVPPSGSEFPKGITSVICTATDTSGNSTNCSFNVTINDTRRPSILCPTNIVVGTDPGTCSRSNVTYAASAIDNCPGVTLACVPPSGSTFAKGVATVTCTATDASNNSTNCSFTVTVNDTEAPSIMCPTNIVASVDTDQCSRSNVIYTVAAPTDNCGGEPTVECVPPSGATFPAGVTTVTCTSSDVSGNGTNCTFTVSILEMIPPSIVCPANMVANTDPGQCTTTNVIFAPSAEDDCPGVRVECVPPSGFPFPKGMTTVTCAAIDASGNRVECTFTVTVSDAEAPSIVCPDSVASADAGQCSKTNVTYAITAIDPCGEVIVDCVPPAGSTFPLGPTMVACTSTDGSGNSTNCSFTVTINDTEPPAITCSTNIVASVDADQCSRSNVTYSIDAVDACSAVTVSCVPASGATFPAGVTTVMCTATDASNNSTNCSFTVRIIEMELPSIVCPTNTIAETDPGQPHKTNVVYVAAGTDNCPGVTVVCVPPSGSTFPRGTTTVTCAATDTSDNRVECSFTVTINDPEPPSIVCPTNIVASTDIGRCGRSNITYSASAEDNLPGVTVACVPPSGSTFAKGVTTVTCTATDTSGNTTNCSFTVTINDTERPTITCPTNLVVLADVDQCSRSNLTFVVATNDNCGEVMVTCTPPSGATFAMGLTSVTCTATDTSGNSTNCSFTVTVQEMRPPSITCPTNIIVAANPGQCARTNVTYSANASDDCGDVTVQCTPPSGSSFPKGMTTVACVATDGSGNMAECSFTVTVNDMEPPSIVCPTNIVASTDPGQCSRSNVLYAAASASDNCPGVTVACVPPSGSTFAKGVTTVTCTATDTSGNTTNCSFTVTINDTERPTITCPTNLVVLADVDQCSRSNVTFSVAASDACGGVTVGCVPASGSTFPKGVTTVICTATDGSGNSTNCSFTVTVNDTQPPSIVCPSNIVDNSDPGQCGMTNVTYAATATDNCPGAIVTCVPPSGSDFPNGLTMVTCTATDAAGNLAECSFAVSINDTEPPSITCPANIVAITDPGQCSRSNVVFNVPVSDNCPGVSVDCSSASGTTFAKGVATVSCIARDLAGNTAECSFTVTINDTEAPTVVCPPDIQTNVLSGTCTQIVTFAASASDNCPDATVSCDPASGSSFVAGTTIVTCTATDSAGNATQCAFQVVVVEPAPLLAITLDGPDVLLSWPLACGNYVVEETISLNPPVPWSPAGGVIVINEGRNTVRYPAEGPMRFYRLKRAE